MTSRCIQFANSVPIDLPGYVHRDGRVRPSLPDLAGEELGDLRQVGPGHTLCLLAPLCTRLERSISGSFGAWRVT